MSIRRLSRDENAQGLVEFALLITTALFTFFLVIDFTRFLYYDNTIQNAARVGAEVASQHCPYRAGSCGTSGTAVGNPYILWSTSCETSGTINLTPSYADCTPGTTAAWSPTCVSTCTNCTNDICVTSVDTSPPSGHPNVTVYVGYNFTPITPLIVPFFPWISCFPLDDLNANHHTVCAKSVGRVF
jgi:Flp pilus assembly protein TadG